MIFRIAEGLGIADPVEWANTVDPVVLDRWKAYHIFKATPPEPERGDIESAREHLNRQIGHKQNGQHNLNRGHAL